MPSNISDIAEDILKSNNRLVDAITSFNNEIGPDNGNDLAELYTAYGLSKPPKQPEFTAMSTKDRIAYRKAERAFELRAVQMNDIHDELVAINSGSGDFGNIAAVISWAQDNMGDVGADVASNLTAWLAIRVKLAAFIAPAMLVEHAVAVNAFTTEIATQVSEDNIRP